MSDSLKGWQPLEQYERDEAREAFYGKHGLRWIIRNHKEELVKAGALVMPGRALLVQPEKFDEAALQIAQRRVKVG